MDARITIGAGPRRAALGEVHSDSPELCPPLSAEQVYHDYAPRVYSMARRMVATDADAEDVTQEVLLQVVRKLPTFRGESAFPTWLHRVTVNAALSHRRRQAVRQDLGLGRSLDAFGENDPLAVSTADRMPAPEEQLASHEIRELIHQAIDELPQAYRAVFVLADVEGLPNADVADRLGMSLPAVKSRLHRARAMLREVLAPHFAAG